MHGLWQSMSELPVLGPPWGPHPHSPSAWGAAMCGSAESGPNPGQGATVARADFADGAENVLHLPPPPAITHGWHSSPSKGVPWSSPKPPVCSEEGVAGGWAVTSHSRNCEQLF